MLRRGNRTRATKAAGARRRRVASSAALAMVAGTLVVLAVQHDGSPIHDVDLNDGGVWVTNGDLQLMARLNSQVKELDLGIVTSATSRDLFQEAASVQALDNGGGNGDKAFFVADVVRGTTLPVALPGTFEVSANRDTVAILDDDSGRVWIRRSDQLEGFNDTVAPDLEVSERSTVVVSRSGAALVADRTAGTVTSYRLATSGAPVQGTEFDFDNEFTDDAVLTAVGDTPVVLQSGKVLRPGEDAVELDGDPMLQQPGPEGESVYAGTTTGLWEIPLGGGDAEEIAGLDAKGRPAAPVVVSGCVHGAWADAGTDNYFRTCGDERTSGEVKPLTEDADLVFRTNRDVVVLNDAAHGNSWMVQLEGLTLVDNWESVDPNAKDQQIAEASDEQQDRNRNEPPTAKPDEFGARPGATVILPVTLNDVDPDGDILALTKPPAMVGGTTFSVVGDGTQVQARVAPDAKGSISFDYEISDGRAAHPPSRAKVTLKLHGPDTDGKPELIKDQQNNLEVADGHQASINVLPAWIDPEGDSLVLVKAEGKGGEVGFRPDGTIDLTDDGEGAGSERIEFVVRGGGAEAKGSVKVQVVDPKKAAPIAVADHFAGLVGTDILLEPLHNDTDPLGGQLTVPRIGVVAGGPAQLTRDTQRGTATFRALRHGTYYLDYQATSSNGRSSKPQMIRVDVHPATGTNRSPVATKDVAVAGANGSALVDVLANDADPDGDVLVVQGIEVPGQWADRVKASLVNKRFVRVELVGDLPPGAQPQFDYLLSDGRSDQVRGTVLVTRAEAGANRRPLAVEDVVTARAGTIINVPVLANDSDPDGDKLSVNQQDLYDVSDRPVVADKLVPVVATGSSIRVMVPDDGTTQLQLGYGVRDPEQGRADTRLVLNIKPDTVEGNRAPHPRPIEERTVTGQRLRVPVDVFGADPDGDPVVFTGVVEPPKFGRIVRSGTNWFEYEPFEGEGNTGTDAFKVQVSDSYGKTGTAEVRIGVAARSLENQSPAALDDTLFVKPGLTIQYPVMQNDSDPDGDPLILEKEKLSAPEGSDVRLVGTFVEVPLPGLGGASEVSRVAQYSVTDGLGSSSTALLTVTGREDAPDHAPTTQDDVASAARLAGKEAGDTVDIDVLANDGDLDGAKADLELAALDGKVSRVVEGKLQVTLAKDSQVVPYLVTDATDQSSFGFVYVTGTDNMPPMLNTATVPVEVVAGEDQAIALDDVVVVRPGRSPKVARTDRIRVSQGDAKADGPGRLVFSSARDYHGPASITLDVLDGEDLNDPTSLQSQITIPITVLPAQNVPPTVRSAAVVVQAGGEEVTLDLQRLASDANEDDRLEFEVTGARDGLEAGIEDDLLTISAEDDASAGEVVLAVAASDGKAEPVEGRVRVFVLGTGAGEQVEQTQPPMTLRELRVPDAKADERAEIDVRSAIVFDPFPGEAKQVSDVTVEAGSGSGASASGTTVQVTPTQAGELVLSYKLSDGSGDEQRDATGRITVVVADRPEVPGRPTAHEGGPDSVRLSWNAPADNGRPITHYEVEWDQGGGGSRECPATQCVIDSLDPGTEYSFTVRAVNEIGPSEPSSPSALVRPDTVPGAMSAPVVADTYTDRDGRLHLSWTPPANEGSDITGFELESIPATRTQSAPPTGRSMVWEGLANGTDYTFKIRAVNERGPGEWSPPSEPHKPFTRPSVMAAPTLQAYNDDGRSGGYLEVSWPAVVEPENGHDPVLDYVVRITRDGVPQAEHQVPASTTMKSFVVENGHQYTAQVRAVNRAGSSDWSSESAASISWDKASAPQNVRKVNDCPSGICNDSTQSYAGEVGFTPPADDGGYPVKEYRYSTSDGASGSFPAGSSGIVRFQGNGVNRSPNQNQSVTITPITDVPGVGEVAGSSASGGDFDPYALPYQPRLYGSSSNEYMKAWVQIHCDGNGRVGSLSLSDGPDGLSCGTSGDVHTRTWSPIEGGSQRCTNATASNAAGSTSGGGFCATARARQIWPTFDYIGQTPDCYRPCYNIGWHVDGFMPGTYTIQWKSHSASGAGYSTCNSPGFGYNRTFSIGSSGQNARTETWFISGTCRKGGALVQVTSDGLLSNSFPPPCPSTEPNC